MLNDISLGTIENIIYYTFICDLLTRMKGSGVIVENKRFLFESPNSFNLSSFRIRESLILVTSSLETIWNISCIILMMFLVSLLIKGKQDISKKNILSQKNMLNNKYFMQKIYHIINFHLKNQAPFLYVLT